ncbi:mitochondrial carrier domain-containing protein, partial [Coniella lustricola]
MSADFWAGYISGAIGIVIGNPLDILKVRLQAGSTSTPTLATTSPPFLNPATGVSLPVPTSTSASTVSSSPLSLLRKFSTGTAAPLLGYGALNALLFVTYNRSEALLNQAFPIARASLHSPSTDIASSQPPTTGTNLWTTFLAGAIGGLATWVVSTPTELIKCRAQLATNPSDASSWAVTKDIWRTQGGVSGLYFGGGITALRDSIGYGFYFWSYELSKRWMGHCSGDSTGLGTIDAAKVLFCGGLAGIVTWVSIFPLDVIKTRLQAQVLLPQTSHYGQGGEHAPLLANADRMQQPQQQPQQQQRLGAIEVARQAYREAGPRVFFRGLGVCSIRAFIVNAVQWAAYEWIMRELGQGQQQ